MNDLDKVLEFVKYESERVKTQRPWDWEGQYKAHKNIEEFIAEMKGDDTNGIH